MSILDRIDAAFVADLDCNTDKVILTAFARHADETGACWLAKRTLATYTNRSEDAVYRALRRLETAGAIVRVPMHDPGWYGVQRCNGYILTAIADSPEKVEAAKISLASRRWRGGEGRADAEVRAAPTRPLEVIPQSGPNQPTAREIGVSGYAAPLSEGGEDEQQQPTDAPTSDTATTNTLNVEYAWLDVFGELTDPRTVKFIANAVRGYSAEEVLRALGLAKGQLENGKRIAKPAKYILTILKNRMNEIGAGRHRTAKQPPAAGHRNQAANWAAVAEMTSQAAEELPDADQADQEAESARRAEAERRQQEAAEWQRAEAERRERQRIADERAQIERERQRERDAAQYAERKRRKVAAEIAACIDNQDAALRMADDFLSVTPDAWWQEKLLDALLLKRNQAGQLLPVATATAILHRALQASPAVVAA